MTLIIIPHKLYRDVYPTVREVRTVSLEIDPIVRCPKCGMKIAESTLKRNRNRCLTCRRPR